MPTVATARWFCEWVRMSVNRTIMAMTKAMEFIREAHASEVDRGATENADELQEFADDFFSLLDHIARTGLRSNQIMGSVLS